LSSYLDELFGLTGRVAVVTGGSSGIGKGIALALGRAGARVVLVARQPAPLDAAVAELELVAGAGLFGRVSADLADSTGIASVASAVTEVFGPPDILVNAAAINPRPPLPQLTAAEWDATIAANLTAPFLLGQEFGPGMAARGWGRIINVASQQAFRAFGNSGGYGASKGGLVSLTRSQAEAWSDSGVCCTALVPGFVATPMTRPVTSDPVRSAAMVARTMVGRNGQPIDFAGAAVLLASPASDYITGTAIFIDGGFSAT
jgi:NAD(P)-dependent dehydrogenase (short-subunit alcohol dehydrogenase family)